MEFRSDQGQVYVHSSNEYANPESYCKSNTSTDTEPHGHTNRKPHWFTDNKPHGCTKSFSVSEPHGRADCVAIDKSKCFTQHCPDVQSYDVTNRLSDTIAN